MVECDLAKVEVAGSTPVSRSISSGSVALASARVYALRAGFGDSCKKLGAVPKW